MARRSLFALLLLVFPTSPLPGQSGDRAYVIRGVRVFDGENVVERQTVVISDGRIAALGSTIAVPAGAQEIAGEGRTLLPGLMDAHIHLPSAFPASGRQATSGASCQTCCCTDREYRFGRPEIAGQAHIWGTVILSIPSLRHSFSSYEDACHVGFHEFAHLLTFDRGHQISVPVGLSPARIQLWEAIRAHELKRVAGGESIVDTYALQPSEFFPCAVEAFFQKPVELRDGHRRLYQFLSRYFRQHPALWEARLRGRSSG